MPRTPQPPFHPHVDPEEDWQSMLDKYYVEGSYTPSAQPEEEGEAIAESEPSSETPHTNTTPEEVLQRYWGFSDFRPKQREIIDSILAGKDTLGLLPTGGGKSITFQVPGLLLPGISLVITPLIALMEDQVHHLHKRNIRAAAIHSGLNGLEQQRILENATRGGYKFLYLSPERLVSNSFLSLLPYMEVSMIVVDECHCISQWGYDFRPSYRNIAILRQHIPSVPVLALTATATPKVTEDIMRALCFREPNIHRRSFVRSNIAYIVRETQDKVGTIMRILQGVAGSSVIYCRNRQRTQEIAKILKEEGITASFYHAGLSHVERQERQKQWMEDEIRVMVATNAFGMGIDKSDVRSVIHWSLPSSLEEYFQEAGRAGRDGEKAFAVALVSRNDSSIIRRRIAEEFPPKEFICKVYDHVNSFLGVDYGEGFERTFLFDFDQMLRTYKLPPRQTLSAVQILEVAGVWEFVSKEESRSRILFTIPREGLYDRSISLHFDPLLRYILRQYTGVFTDYIYIEEDRIAKAIGITAQAVYEMLIALARQRVISYIPRTDTPRLHFLTRREEGRHLQISHSVYEERKERLVERIEKVIDYCSKSNQCRGIALVSYFGEKDAPNCGHCDVCIQQKKQHGAYRGLSLSKAIELLKNEAVELLYNNESYKIALWRKESRVPAPLFSEALDNLVQNHIIRLDGDCIQRPRSR